eukprot:668801-Hanusia_phi.AAC.3
MSGCRSVTSFSSRITGNLPPFCSTTLHPPSSLLPFSFSRFLPYVESSISLVVVRNGTFDVTSSIYMWNPQTEKFEEFQVMEEVSVFIGLD